MGGERARRSRPGGITVLLDTVQAGMGRFRAASLVLDHDEVGVRAERDEDQLSVPAYPGFHQVDGRSGLVPSSQLHAVPRYHDLVSLTSG